MTDLAARLRDVLSDEMLIDLLLGAQDYEAERNGTPRRSREYCLPEFRDCVVKAFLPFLSSLLEEREREIREAQRRVFAGDVASLRATYQQRGKYSEGARDACECLLSRLASSSSPGEEK